MLGLGVERRKTDRDPGGRNEGRLEDCWEGTHGYTHIATGVDGRNAIVDMMVFVYSRP